MLKLPADEDDTGSHKDLNHSNGLCKGEKWGLIISKHTNLIKTHALLLHCKKNAEYYLINNKNQNLIELIGHQKYTIKAVIQDLAQGEGLFDFVNRTNMRSIKFAIDIGIQLCNALDHLHGNNLIYRDVKLDNIIYDEKIIRLYWSTLN